MMNVQVYRCELCGNMVEKVVNGGGTLVCCGQEMTLVGEDTTEAATEKHIPVVEKVDGGIKVTVGSVVHPMTDAHYIQWIEVVTGQGVLRKHLTPKDAPVATFLLDTDEYYVRAYCNIHGLWKGA